MSGCAPDTLFSKYNYSKRTAITKRTRNSHMLNISLYKPATGQRTVYFRTVNLWNSLDSTLKLKPTPQERLPFHKHVPSSLKPFSQT